MSGICYYSRWTANPDDYLSAWWESGSTSCKVPDSCCKDDSGVTTCQFSADKNYCQLYADQNKIPWKKHS